jgi:ribosome biogenesis GTPase
MPSSPSSADREGRVVSGHGRHVVVEADDGRRTLCHARGKKNETVVGRPGALAAERRRRRGREVLPRQEPPLSAGRLEDQGVRRQPRPAALVVAAEPGVQRIAAGAGADRRRGGGHPGRIVLNKQDLPSWPRGGRAARVPTPRSASRCRRRLKKEPAERATSGSRRCSPAAATLVLGPSGAGKSTLVNLLVRRRQGAGRRDLAALDSGRHTTTATHWYWIDAARRAPSSIRPGFQEFGLRHIAANELAG